MPEKLKVELSTDATVLRTGKTHRPSISRPTSSTARRPRAHGSRATCASRSTPIPSRPSPSTPSARRRSARTYEPPLITLTGPETDDKGKSKIDWAGDQVKDTDLPLRAQITARVFEPGNGRATKTDKSLPLRTRDVYLGIQPDLRRPLRPRRHRHRLRRRGASTPTASRSRDAVEYSIERITYDYQWYQSDGRWRWQSITARARDRCRHAGSSRPTRRSTSPSACNGARIA